MEVIEKPVVTSPYSVDRGSYTHTGIDLTSGTGIRSIKAVARGKVIKAENRMRDNFIVNGNSPVSEWAGNYIVLEHADGVTSQYSHLAYNSINVSVGEIVEEGRIIADEGESGYADGVHLDFEMKQNGRYLDPTEYALGKKSLKGYEENKTEYLNLNKEADTWRIYPMNVQPVVGNECGQLLPKQFGGLSYTIQGYTLDDVAIISTRDYGNVQIYINTPLASITKVPIYSLVK